MNQTPDLPKPGSTSHSVISPVLEQAIALYGDKKLDEAEALCKRILQAIPDDAGAIHLQGLIALAHGGLNKSVQLIERAVELDPLEPCFLNNLAVVLIRSDQLTKALITCHKSLALEQNHHIVVQNLAQILEKLGEPNMARDARRYAGQLADELPVDAMSVSNFWNSQGLVLERLGQRDLAVSCLEYAIHIYKENISAHSNLRDLRKTETVPDYSPRPATASKPEIKSLPLPEALQIALDHHRADRLHEAEAIYREIIRLHPDNHDALHLLGVIAHQRGNNIGAAELIRNAIQINPGNPDAYQNLAIVLRDLGEFEHAALAYRSAIAIKPDYAEAHNGLAFILERLGQLDEAVEHYRKAIAYAPKNTAMLNSLANVLAKQGHYVEAESIRKTAAAKA